MRRMMFALAAPLILGALTISLPQLESKAEASPVAEPVVVFGDACRRVSFKFTNRHNSGGQIKFQRIRYYNRANGRWQSEDVSNLICNQGQTCTTNNNNLRDSEGEDITKIRLVFKYKPASAGANWSDEVQTGDLIPTNPTCNADRTYGPGSEGWVIR